MRLGLLSDNYCEFSSPKRRCDCASAGPPPGDLLLDGLGVGLGKQVQHGAAEVVGVAVGVAQLVGYCVQEQVATWRKTAGKTSYIRKYK